MTDKLKIGIVAFNGPPRVGKDHMARHVANCLRDVRDCHMRVDRMSMPLKRAIGGIYSFFVDTDGNSYADKTKDMKGVFSAYSLREDYIALSHYMKERYGPDIFGRLFLRRIEQAKAIIGPYDRRPIIFLVPDAGFAEEWVPVAAEYPVQLIRLSRAGCDFSFDSRSVISIDNAIETIDINNDGTLKTSQEVLRVVSNFVDIVENSDAANY